jgi:hypothetical protein
MNFQSLYLPVGNHHRVWLREISEATFSDQQLEDLGSDYGLFVAIENLTDGTLSVIGKAPDFDRGQTLMNLVAEGLATRFRVSHRIPPIYELRTPTGPASV